MSHKIIAIVDDERVSTQLLGTELKKEGYEVFTAANGKEGLELIKKINPHLVILDVVMPVMDGYQVLKILKEDDSTKEIPVVMLTAKALEEDIQKGFSLGAVDYITKPFYTKLLIKRMKQFFKKHNDKENE